MGKVKVCGVKMVTRGVNEFRRFVGQKNWVCLMAHVTCSHFVLAAVLLATSWPFLVCSRLRRGRLCFSAMTKTTPMRYSKLSKVQSDEWNS